ncbi:MAG: LruC domain-containing protein [Bacteroidales bacterium]
MKIFKYIINILIITVLLSSCIKDETIITSTELSNINNEKISEMFSNLNPSPDFNWKLYSNKIITLKTNSQYPSSCEFFTDFPLDKDAKSIGIFTIDAATPVNIDLFIPSSAKILYLKYTDATNAQEIFSYTVPIGDTSIVINSSRSIKSSNLGLKTKGGESKDQEAIGMLTADNFTNYQESIELAKEIPADAKELETQFISGNWQEITSNGVYYIPAGITTKIQNGDYANKNNDVTIYVEGTLTGAEVYNTTLIFLNGGTMTSNANLSLNNNSKLIIGLSSNVSITNIWNNGTLDYISVLGILSFDSYLNKCGDIYVGPNASFYCSKSIDGVKDMFIEGDFKLKAQDNNYSIGTATVSPDKGLFITETGNVELNTLKLNGGTLYNANLLTANNGIESQNNNEYTIKNCGNIFAGKIENTDHLFLSNGSIMKNYDVETMTSTPCTKISISSVDSENYLLNASYINTENLEFTGNISISGSESEEGNRSLWSSNTILIKNQNGNSLTINNELTLESNKIYGNSANTFYSKAINPASFAEIDKSDLNVVAANKITHPGNEGIIVDVTPIEGNLVSKYTVRFEDLWPYVGDYDLNDLIAHISNISTKLVNNKVTEMTINGELTTVGSTLDLAFGLQLDNVLADNITSVIYDNNGHFGTNKEYFSLASNNVEKDQHKAVIPILSDAHKYLSNVATLEKRSLLSYSNKPSAQPFEAIITFKESVDQNDLVQDSFNYFIIVKENKIVSKRAEIHMKGYDHTDLASDKYVNNISNISYATEKGFPWGLIIPDYNGTQWKGPEENKTLYSSEFESWANSNGTISKDWYINYDLNNID